MNRFLTKKKGRDASKWKKGQPEPKPELDLTTALPSDDNFRTSLIMNSLSARFSMLREQDDPNSKLGKASDDSVLQPKRQSRLADFGYTPHGLSDIAEVSSISSSIRPNMASDRKGSDGYATDDDASPVPGSVMNRARPGEGNVLFGGRQKVYKIPAKATGLGGKALYDDDLGLSAFQRYRIQEREGLRNHESAEPVAPKETREEVRQARKVEEEIEQPQQHPVREPSNASTFNTRRETSSSAASAPSNTRSSTAATSIASQDGQPVVTPATQPSGNTSPVQPTFSLDRSTTKARRLYEQGLEHHMHEQQFSAMNRLNSIQKQRTLSSKPVLTTKSTSNLHERFNRSGHPGVTSPPPSAPLSHQQSFGPPKDASSSNSSPFQSQPHSPPISPIGSDKDDVNVLSAALDYNDRGKATALGAFNKPKQFDAQEYQQRLMQLQRGRETPEPRKDIFPPRKESPSRPVQALRSEFERRRADSQSSNGPRSRSTSTSQRAAPSAFAMFQNAANQMRVAAVEPPRPLRTGKSFDALRQDTKQEHLRAPSRQEAPMTKPEFPRAGSRQDLRHDPSRDISRAESRQESRREPGLDLSRAASRQDTRQEPQSLNPPQDSARTFFASSTGSDSEDEPEPPPKRAITPAELQRRLQAAAIPGAIASSIPPPPMHDHPALRRLSSHSRELITEPSTENKTVIVQTIPERDEPLSAKENLPKSDGAEIDSPTLGPGGGGLSGLVRQHLRNASAVSSNYDDDRDNSSFVPARESAVLPNPRASDLTGAHSSYSHSNPWDLEDFDGGYYGEIESQSSSSPIDGIKPRPLGSRNSDLRRSALPKDTDSNRTMAPWEQEIRKTHTRGASTETQQEREAFSNELAQRQKAIQESLRSKVEEEERSSSPAPGAGPFRGAWGILKPKASRESMAGKPVEAPLKAMKMLGLGGSSTNVSTTSLSGSSEKFYKSDYWKSEDSRVGQEPRGPFSKLRSHSPARPNDQDIRKDFESPLRRGASEDSNPDREPRDHEPRNPKGRSPPTSSKSSMRNRSSSEVSGRSRSRTGRHRDDLEKTVVEGTGLPGNHVPEQVPAIPPQHINSAAPSPVVPPPQPPQERPAIPPQSRLRSNSRSNYFDSKSLHPIHVNTQSPYMGASRLSPAATSPGVGLSPSLSHSPNGLHSPGISPGGASVRASPVPAFSANSTPPISAATTPVLPGFEPDHVPARSKTARKKSICKAHISEPIFISSTSVVDTVDLPPGASLKNGMELPPPVPPINPLRKRFGFGRSEQSNESNTTSFPSLEGSTYSADETERRPRPRQKLRKISSEGKSLKDKANQPITSPAIPPPLKSANNVHHPIVEGAMF